MCAFRTNRSSQDLPTIPSFRYLVRRWVAGRLEGDGERHSQHSYADRTETRRQESPVGDRTSCRLSDPDHSDMQGNDPFAVRRHGPIAASYDPGQDTATLSHLQMVRTVQAPIACGTQRHPAPSGETGRQRQLHVRRSFIGNQGTTQRSPPTTAVTCPSLPVRCLSSPIDIRSRPISIAHDLSLFL